MTDAPYPIRAARSDEMPTFFDVLTRAFGEDFTSDDLARELLTAEPERSLAAYEGEAIVATAGAFTFDVAVPGGRVPAAGVTYVGVRATHRRQGLLNALMTRQLADIHDRSEPLALLWASESSIYGRYGYGLASRMTRVEVHRIESSLRTDLEPDPSVTVTWTTTDALADKVVAMDAEMVDERPGQFVRDRRWIDTMFADPESYRNGMSSLQAVRADRDGRLVGYATFRSKNQSVRPYGLPDGEVLVMAQSARDPAADLALTRLLLSMDLMRVVRWWNRPADTPLPHVLADPRQARTALLDGLWARIVDVPAALSARRYLHPVDVVLDVADDRCDWNAGRWRLHVDDSGVATCEKSDADPDVTLGVESLGAAYLGGTTLQSLADAGRVAAADPRTLAGVSTAFGWHRAPWCPVIF